MARSLQETARAVLMKESDDPTPDRDAKLTTPVKNTLRPGASAVESRFANPGANSTGEGEYEDLGPAAVTPTDVPPSAKNAKGAKKDTSKASQAQVPSEPPKVMEDEENLEEFEISEELEKFIDDMVSEGKSEEEISTAIAENFELVDEDSEVVKEEEEEELEEENLEEKEEKEDDEESDSMEENCSKKVSMKEHIDALLSGENLSEDFRAKAETLFESAVSFRLNEEVSVLEEAYDKALTEEVERVATGITEAVNDYLNYVVEQWMLENEIAIESGLRTEITEEFITGLKNLFEENYFDLPEEKVNVIEKLGESVQEIERKLNEEIENNVQLSRQLTEANRKIAFNEACENLTETQVTKLTSLTEGIDAETTEDFSKKLKVIKENYFPTKKTSVKPTLDNLETSDGKQNVILETSPRMAAYVNTLGRSSKVL